MKRPAIFFDRDNTLIISDGYLGDPSQVELVPGSADAVARARELGYAVVVFSNQSGVARGLFAEDDVRAVNAKLDDLLRSAHPSATIDRHVYCPYHPQAVLEEYRRDSDLRKPRPGMIHLAEQEMELDLARSWVIGDAPRDVEAGQAAGCRTILFADPALPRSPAAAQQMAVPPEQTVSSLKDALDYIERVAEPVIQRVTAQPVGLGTADLNDLDADRSDRPPLPPPPAAEDGRTPASSVYDPERLERLAEQILHELRRRREEPTADFSVPRLLAGISQVIALALAFMSYLYRGTPSFTTMMLTAIFLQALTLSLLIMGRMK